MRGAVLMSKTSIEMVLQNGYCVGCGACAFEERNKVCMKMQKGGFYLPEPFQSFDKKTSAVCPFSDDSLNEDQVAQRLFDHQCKKHEDHLGFYFATYAGFVKAGDYRSKGSSGGMVSWMLDKLMEENLIDKVIHVRQSHPQTGRLFTYCVSVSSKEIQDGAKSKYYPVEISQVLKYVEENEGRYAFVGVPCFVKAVRLISMQNPVIAKRICYAIGLVCGHLKSDRFAKTMGWELGILPDNLVSFDFRFKLPDRPANQYGIKATGLIDGKTIEKTSPTKNLFVSDWGHGFFKLKACDYCDDVLGETADISFGDAWLPEFVKDTGGTNIVVIRNPKLASVINKYMNELSIIDVSPEKIILSQAGGFRHRRQGLAYRLYLLDQSHEWRPKKRVMPSDAVSDKRKRIYKERIILRELSHSLINKAETKKDFELFIKEMKPAVQRYNRMVRLTFTKKIIRKSKAVLRSVMQVIKQMLNVNKRNTCN